MCFCGKLSADKAGTNPGKMEVGVSLRAVF